MSDPAKTPRPPATDGNGAAPLADRRGKSGGPRNEGADNDTDAADDHDAEAVDDDDAAADGEDNEDSEEGDGGADAEEADDDEETEEDDRDEHEHEPVAAGLARPTGAAAGVTRVPLWIVIPVAVVAAAGGIEHAVTPPYAFPARLNTDIVEVSWIVLFLLIILINFSEKVGFPGAGSVTLRRERAELAATTAIAATEDLDSARNQLAQLLQGWTNAAALYTGLLEKYGVDEQSVNEIATRFVLDRMEEARPIFAPETENVRLSLWWYSRSIGGLAYLYGTEAVDASTLTAVFRPREGLMGQAYVENQMYNLPNALHSKYYKRHRKRPPSYRGLLLVPVREGGTRAMAMISVDRARARGFDATAEAVGWALSDLVSLAYTHPLFTKFMPSFQRND